MAYSILHSGVYPFLDSFLRSLPEIVELIKQRFPRARLLICRVPCQRRRRPGNDRGNPPERLQHFAPCDVPTSHPAMSQLRTLRCLNFAPCEVSGSHPVKFQVRTLRSFGFAPCEVREALGGNWHIATGQCGCMPCEIRLPKP